MLYRLNPGILFSSFAYKNGADFDVREKSATGDVINVHLTAGSGLLGSHVDTDILGMMGQQLRGTTDGFAILIPPGIKSVHLFPTFVSVDAYARDGVCSIDGYDESLFGVDDSNNGVAAGDANPSFYVGTGTLIYPPEYAGDAWQIPSISEFSKRFETNQETKILVYYCTSSAQEYVSGGINPLTHWNTLSNVDIQYTIGDPVLFDNWRANRTWAGGTTDADGLGGQYCAGYFPLAENGYKFLPGTVAGSNGNSEIRDEYRQFQIDLGGGTPVVVNPAFAELAKLPDLFPKPIYDELPLVSGLDYNNQPKPYKIFNTSFRNSALISSIGNVATLPNFIVDDAGNHPTGAIDSTGKFILKTSIPIPPGCSRIDFVPRGFPDPAGGNWQATYTNADGQITETTSTNSNQGNAVFPAITSEVQQTPTSDYNSSFIAATKYEVSNELRYINFIGEYTSDYFTDITVSCLISDTVVFESWLNNGYQPLTNATETGSQSDGRFDQTTTVATSFNPTDIPDEKTINTYDNHRSSEETAEKLDRNTKGFVEQLQSSNDPEVKYPNHKIVSGKKIIEPDTNRLARVENVFDVPSYKRKKDERVGKFASELSINQNKSGSNYKPVIESYAFPVDTRTSPLKYVNSSGNLISDSANIKLKGWAQPPVPYNPTYPYNKTITTERGHIVELDDSKDRERINIEHRTGTFTEIDANGSRVNKIVGDNFEILERDNHVLIKGNCSVTIIGNSNIKVEGNTLMQSLGDVKIQSAKTLEITSDAQLTIASRKGIDLVAEKGDINLIAMTGAVAVSAKTAIRGRAASGPVQFNSSSKIDLKANSGSVNIQGEKTFIQSGTAASVATIPNSKIPQAQFISKKAGTLKPRRITRSALKEITSIDEVSTKAMYETPEESRRPANLIETEYPPIAETETPTALATIQTPKEPEVEPNPEYTATECGIDPTKVSSSLKLSTNITLGFFDVGESGLPKIGETHYGKTAMEIICNLKYLAQNVLEPILTRYPNAKITSAWRSERVNKKYGGSTTSDHLSGKAIDIQFSGFTREQTYAAAVELASWTTLNFKQLILEYKGNSTWLHISYDKDNNKNQVLTMDAATNRVLATNQLKLYA